MIGDLRAGLEEAAKELFWYKDDNGYPPNQPPIRYIGERETKEINDAKTQGKPYITIDIVFGESGYNAIGIKEYRSTGYAIYMYYYPIGTGSRDLVNLLSLAGNAVMTNKIEAFKSGPLISKPNGARSFKPRSASVSVEENDEMFLKGSLHIQFEYDYSIS